MFGTATPLMTRCGQTFATPHLARGHTVGMVALVTRPQVHSVGGAVVAEHR